MDSATQLSFEGSLNNETVYSSTHQPPIHVTKDRIVRFTGVGAEMNTNCTHNTHDYALVHCALYSLIVVTESVDELTEVVGLAGSPTAEDGCVQMLSSVTVDKLSEVSNGVNISCRFLVSVNVYLLVPNTSISLRYKRPVDVMSILRYFPRASVVRFITTSFVRASLTSENVVLSVLVERCSALWTERLRVGILLGFSNVMFTLSTHHPWGMSSTTKGLVLLSHPYTPRVRLSLSRAGWTPSLIAHIRRPLLTVH